jgi:hypothetical protein
LKPNGGIALKCIIPKARTTNINVPAVTKLSESVPTLTLLSTWITFWASKPESTNAVIGTLTVGDCFAKSPLILSAAEPLKEVTPAAIKIKLLAITATQKIKVSAAAP